MAAWEAKRNRQPSATVSTKMLQNCVDNKYDLKQFLIAMREREVNRVKPNVYYLFS